MKFKNAAFTEGFLGYLAGAAEHFLEPADDLLTPEGQLELRRAVARQIALKMLNGKAAGGWQGLGFRVDGNGRLTDQCIIAMLLSQTTYYARFQTVLMFAAKEVIKKGLVLSGKDTQVAILDDIDGQSIRMRITQDNRTEDRFTCINLFTDKTKGWNLDTAEFIFAEITHHGLSFSVKVKPAEALILDEIFKQTALKALIEKMEAALKTTFKHAKVILDKTIGRSTADTYQMTYYVRLLVEVDPEKGKP